MPPRYHVAKEPGEREGSYFYHIEDGFHYHSNNTPREGVEYFKCVLYERGCRGRAVFDSVEGFRHTQEHNHDPDPLYPDEMALRRMIIQRALTLEYVAPQQIVLEEGLKFQPLVRSRVQYQRMRNPIRNARLSNFPELPRDLAGLTRILRDPVHRVISMTEDGEDNLYGGSVTDGNGQHHILFTSARLLERLRQFTVIHGDGTFKSTPAGVEAVQVFTIVVVWRHTILPVAWILMESETQEAYTAVFTLLSELMGPERELQTVITDFETGQQNAWEEVFDVSVQGCLWHLARAWIKAVQDLNLLPQMRILEIKRIIRLLLALPLLPEHLILEGFNIIIREARNEGNYIYAFVAPLLRWVWKYWVSRPWRRRRMTVFGSERRTNNACEASHRILRLTVGTHQNIYEFISKLASLEQKVYTNFLGLDEGRRVGRGRRWSAVMNDARLQNLSEDLIHPPGPLHQAIFNFLRRASHTMDSMVEELLAPPPQRRRRGRR